MLVVVGIKTTAVIAGIEVDVGVGTAAVRRRIVASGLLLYWV